MTTNLRYNSCEFVLPIEFHHVFCKSSCPNIRKLVKCFTRKEMIKLVLTLANEYANEPYQKMSCLFSDDNFWKVYTSKRLNQYVSAHSSAHKKYCVCSFQVVLELLRYSFSLPPSQHSVYDSNKYTLEFDLVKTIALLNEKIEKFKVQNEKSPSQLMSVAVGSNQEIQQFDFKNQFQDQMNLCTTFFTYLTSQEKYKPLYDAFLQKYGIDDWREYAMTLLFLTLLAHQHAGILDLNSGIDPHHLINPNVLYGLSMSYDTPAIPYASKNEFDNYANSDYRAFRDKPIIKLEGNEYVVYFSGFVLNRLYSSLYFDFKDLSKTLHGKSIDVDNLFTEQFIEKTVLYSLLKKIAAHKYLPYSEEDCKQQNQSNENELGCPDYLLQNPCGSQAILFECKDIKINGWVKEQRDYKVLAEELKNKLQMKEWTRDYENHKRKRLKKSRRIGTGQLAGHCSNIRNGRFIWGKNLGKNATVYPVLVIADNRLIVNGLPELMESMYEECLADERIKISSVNRPLILLSPLCLLKHSEDFKMKGFEPYFEEYYQEVKQCNGTSLDNIITTMTFEEFMDKYPFHLEKTYDNLKDELFRNRKIHSRK